MRSRLLIPLLAAAGLLPAVARAQTLAQVRKGSLAAETPVSGRAQPYNTWPAFAPFDGLVQSVLVLPGQWVSKDETLAILVDKELAALLASEPTTPPEIVAKRWGVVYRPAEIKCPFDHGYIVTVLVKSRQQVRSGDALLSAAPALKLSAQVPAEVTTGLSQGAKAVVWLKSDPDATVDASVFEVKPPANKSDRRALAEVTLLLPPRADNIDSGSELEGKVTFARQNVLKIPSAAIQRIGGRAFATVELKVGADNGQETELLTPLDEGTSVVVPGGAAATAPAAPKSSRRKRDVTPKPVETESAPSDQSSPEEAR